MTVGLSGVVGSAPSGQPSFSPHYAFHSMRVHGHVCATPTPPHPQWAIPVNVVTLSQPSPVRVCLCGVCLSIPPFAPPANDMWEVGLA